MQSQACHGSEPAATGATVVGALVVETGYGEPGGTGEGNRPEVQPPVLLQVGALREALAAVQALVGPYACVGQLVPAEVGQRSKGLATRVALEGPLTCVCPQVVTHVDQLLEALAADPTAVPPFWGPMYCAPVPGEPRGRGEGLGALRAGQLDRQWWWWWRRCGLSRSWGSCGCRGRCPTFASMGAPVIEELGHVAEGLATATAVQGVGGMGPPVGHQRELGAEATATVHAQIAGFTTV